MQSTRFDYILDYSQIKVVCFLVKQVDFRLDRHEGLNWQGVAVVIAGGIAGTNAERLCDIALANCFLSPLGCRCAVNRWPTRCEPQGVLQCLRDLGCHREFLGESLIQRPVFEQSVYLV